MVLKEKNFFRLWIGQILSQSGARMVQIAVLWWGINQAGPLAGRWAGGLLVLSALPSLLFVKIFGLLIDRWPSRNILLLADIASALFVGFLALGFYKGIVSTPFIYAMGFGLATCQALLDPTLNKSVAQVASAESLDKAVTLASSTQSLASFAGAMLGAVLIDKIGVVLTLSLASLGYLIAAAASGVTYFRPVAGEGPNEEISETPWQVLNHYPFLKKLLFGFGFVNFFGTPTLLVLPLYVKRVLEMKASDLGMLEGALWLGLICGTWCSRSIKYQGSILHVAFICLAFLGSAFALPALVPGFAISLGCLTVAGLALGINNAKFFVLFQNQVADREKGRFFAILSAIVGFSFPVAYLFFGLMVDLVPVTSVMVAQGLGVIGVAFYFLLLQDQGGRRRKNSSLVLGEV